MKHAQVAKCESENEEESAMESRNSSPSAFYAVLIKMAVSVSVLSSVYFEVNCTY